MTDVETLIASGARRLAAAGIENSRSDARLLLAHALGVSTGDLFHHTSVNGSQGPIRTYDAFVSRRSMHEPIAYITGKREFWSLIFDVGPGVLIPRPETETLVEEAMKAFPDRAAPLTVLDIGTGSACLPVALLTEYPNASAIGVDISSEALSWARRNVERHGLMQRCRLREGPWTEGLEECFDIIFCNPPYIETATISSLDADVVRFEPLAALDGGRDGLDAYDALAPRIASHLNRTGRAFVELGPGQAAAVRRTFAAAGLETLRVAPDLSGRERCLVASRAV